MFSRDRWQEIFQTISKNKLRTFLSGFTVALGIFIFVILFGFGNGLKNSFKEFFMDDATNILRLFPGKTSMPYKGYKSNREIEFDNDDMTAIKNEFAPFIEYMTPRNFGNGMVKYKAKSNSYSYRAVGPAHQYAEKTIIMNGRYINQQDIISQAKHAVIGRLERKDLFDDQEAIGQYIDINNSVYKVVGVFQDEGGDNEERYIYIPYTTLQLAEMNNDKVRQIVIAFKPEMGYAGAMQLASFQQNQQFALMLQIIVTFVALGTLIAGIIGISNIMVFVVKERTKELGIRKALGATPRSVIGMILQESIFITTISGYVGLFLGVLLLNYIGTSLEDYFIKNPYMDINTGIAATFVLVIFGTIAGYIPARRAAKIKPIVALRDE